MAEEHEQVPKRLAYTPGDADFGNGRAFLAVPAALALIIVLAVPLGLATLPEATAMQSAGKAALMGLVLLALVPSFTYGLRLAKGDARFEADAGGLTTYYLGQPQHRMWADIGPMETRLLPYHFPRLLFPGAQDARDYPLMNPRRLLCIEPYAIPFGRSAMVLRCAEELEAMRRHFSP